MTSRLKRGALAWGAAGATLLAWVALAAGLNAGTNSEVKEARSQAAKETRFYQVVAGELSGSEPGPANRLARDLRETPVERLSSFQGDSNRYGGISEELGFDPFNGVDCQECGFLDPDVIENTEQVKNGDLPTVLEEIQDEVPVQDDTPGPPAFLWFLWIISYPIYAGYVFVKDRRSVEARYRDFAEERSLIGQLREAQHALPPGSQDWNALDQLADNLQEQIEQRVSYRQSKTQRIKIDTLTDEASSVLDDIAAGNRELD